MKRRQQDGVRRDAGQEFRCADERAWPRDDRAGSERTERKSAPAGSLSEMLKNIIGSKEPEANVEKPEKQETEEVQD